MRRRLIGTGLAAGIAGGAVALGAIAADPREALFAWHFALMFGTTTAVGALFLLMLGHVTNAAWFIVVRRPVEHMVGTLPVLAILFIPSLLFLEVLFPWALDGVEMDRHVAELVTKKRAYLNDADFIWRTAGYLLALVLAGELLRYWSRRQDRGADDRARARYAHWMRVLSALGFPLLGLVVTTAFVDWIMSLEPAWYSTMFGAAVLCGGFVAAVGWLALSMVLGARRGWLEATSEGHRHAVGRVLFAGICFWGYVNFVQYLIIWIADLPEEIRFLERRQQLGWQWTGLAIVLGHLVIPFFLLLSRRLKEIPATLAVIGGWMVVFHLIAVFYLVVPAHRPDARIHWADPFALAAVVGLMLAMSALRSRHMEVVPVGAPRLDEGLEYDSP